MASVDKITVLYGGAAVLRDFSATFPAGAVTAVVGRSGCGKTTLLSVLLGLIEPDGGAVHGFSRPSAVFQEDRLCPFLTGAKNIALAAGCTEKEAEAALLAVGFDPADMQKNALQLSGGMARRVAIVRALLAPGDAVLLDEPFKGLDDATRALVLTFFHAHLNGRTVVLVTHDPRDAADLGAAHTINMEP